MVISINVTVNNESDVSVEYFVEQMCKFTYDKNDFISTAELHKKYGEFCMKNNLQVEKNANTFSRKIRKIFPDDIEKNRKRLGKDENVNVWYGVVLKE